MASGYRLGGVASRSLSGDQLSDHAAAAYLEHLGVDATPGEVDAATLTAVARAHVARVPYENIDIYRGEPPGIEPLACVERVIGGRGGYCFHLNGALVTLLEWLEVDVTRHVSGVQGGGREAPGPNGNHLGITVVLPDGSRWFVDAGLGDGPVDPLPLVFGTYEQSGFTYELRPSDFDPEGWRLEHDPRGAFVGADFAAAPARTEQFMDMHRQLSTEPTSGFVRVADIMRRTPEGVEVLRGCMHLTTTSAGTESVEVESEGDWWGTVIDGFGLAYGDLPAEERARVWGMVRSAHEAWETAGGS
jgi:N-hydroxyarylamine O-acetyltransferase